MLPSAPHSGADASGPDASQATQEGSSLIIADDVHQAPALPPPRRAALNQHPNVVLRQLIRPARPQPTHSTTTTSETMRLVAKGDASSLLEAGPSSSGRPSSSAAPSVHDLLGRAPFASLGAAAIAPAAAATTAAAAAVRPPVVREPRTGTLFPGELEHCAGSKGCPVALGAGSRTKRVAGVKTIDVYTLALYVDPAAAKQLLGGRGGSSREALAKEQAMFDGAQEAGWLSVSGGSRGRACWQARRPAHARWLLLSPLTHALCPLAPCSADDAGQPAEDAALRHHIWCGRRHGSLPDSWPRPPPALARVAVATVAACSRCGVPL